MCRTSSIMRKRTGMTRALVLLVALMHVAATCASSEKNNSKKKKILSLGGNGMIGSATLARLISKGEREEEGYDITLVSRGSWPFDSETRIAPFVKSINCDRQLGLANCPELMEDIESTDQYYAVLDFSGYTPDWVKDAAEVLKDKTRVYVYVSTDSVYEVVEGKPYAESGRRSVETDAVRPTDEDLRKKLNEFDDYGDEKFAGEEVLVEQRGVNGTEGVPYVFLRFCDVIGPRDNTGRFLTLYTWIMFGDLESLALPNLPIQEDAVEGTSITYVEDAAQSIILAFDEDNRNAWDDRFGFNIACQEIFNVTSQIVEMGHMMGKHYIPVKDEHGIDEYPSVEKGPVDVSKAMDKLGFVPTRQEVALRETLKWYDKLFREDEEIQEEVEDELVDILESLNEYQSEEEQEEAIDNLLNEFKNEIEERRSDEL
mmetsp:Transcript_11705/g.26195  ORF Transcript_11705/g.26195 Transcript_11705/m.26195 type:complete len:429 (-) Transcript_11705:21-1307(-)